MGRGANTKRLGTIKQLEDICNSKTLFLIPQVFGHGWLCHPTSPKGQFSEHFHLSTCFVIQKVKVQTLILFNKKQVFKLPLFLSENWNCPLADTYSYADWQGLQWLPVTPTFASPVQRYKAEGLAVSRPLSEATHNWTREQRTKYSNWFDWIWGLSNETKLSPNFYLHPVPLFELLSRLYWANPTTTWFRP